MAERLKNRRTVIKAVGTLGTIAALAVPTVVLPTATQAGQSADATLLEMGQEAARLRAEEIALNKEWHRLARVADEMAPPPAALLACTATRAPLVRDYASGAILVDRQAEARLRARHADELLAVLDAWRADHAEALRISGYEDVDQALDHLTTARDELQEQIAATPATTTAGLMVKLQALEVVHDAAFAPLMEEWVRHVDRLPLPTRLMASALLDASHLLQMEAGPYA